MKKLLNRTWNIFLLICVGIIVLCALGKIYVMTDAMDNLKIILNK